MLRNYGYKVIDLGKDVPAGKIIETALSHRASVVGLSALMTTTMMQTIKKMRRIRTTIQRKTTRMTGENFLRSIIKKRTDSCASSLSALF